MLLVREQESFEVRQQQARLPRRRLCRLEVGDFSLVGAGPGDPELLTVAAYRAICDPLALVIADRLVSPEVLDLVRGELRVAKKTPGCAEEAQREIYRWITEGLRSDRKVIRLKIGDPFIFGRGGEEILYVREHLGVEATVVPSISAAIAAPSAAGVPLTHRGVADKVVLTTGFGRDGSEPDLPEFQEFQTVVMLMGVGRVRRVCDLFVSLKNFPKHCPALVIEKATLKNHQRVIIGDLQDLADLVETHQIKAPATIVVGDAVRVLYPHHPHGLIQHKSQTTTDEEMAFPSLGGAIGDNDIITQQIMTDLKVVHRNIQDTHRDKNHTTTTILQRTF